MSGRHLTEAELGQYRQRTLSPTALLAADDHLAECQECRKSLERASGTAASHDDLWRALTGAGPLASSHLSYEDLVGVVEEDPAVADRSEIRQHLSICKDCAGEVADLRHFRAGHMEPGTAKLTSTIAGPPFWRLTMWAGAAAAIALAAFLGFRALRPNTPPAPALVAQLNDAGGNITLDSSGGLATPSPFGPGEVALVTDTLLHQRIEPSATVAQLAGPPGTLLGETGTPSGLQLIAPLGTTTPSDKPAFQWRPVPSGAYIVAIYDDHYKKVAESPVLRQTEWTPNRPLPRGQIYTWQLTALIKGKQLRAPLPPVPEARFQVLSLAEAEQLEKAQSEHANSHLLLGILYARAGALDDAERELAALLAANPDSKLAKDLLASVQQLRRKPKA
jgi:hypothetical protein